jgi:16S rRNA (guanine527-N7)-methyltransferase
MPLLKGAKVDDELAEADRDWTMAVRRVPSQTNADGVVLHVTELKRR